jgi:hypothetical protein
MAGRSGPGPGRTLLLVLALWLAAFGAQAREPDGFRPRRCASTLASLCGPDRSLGRLQDFQPAGGPRGAQAQVSESESGPGGPCSDLAPARPGPLEVRVGTVDAGGYEAPGLAFQPGCAVDGSRPRPPPRFQTL